MEKKNVYVRMIYEEGEDHWDDKYGPYSESEAKEQSENLKKEFAYAISQGCAEVGYVVNGNYKWSL